MDKEVRNIPADIAEIRTEQGSRWVEGYGIVFNSESRDLGGFTEIILPEAVGGVLETSDILARLDHNKNRGVLARSKNGKGTMTLTPDTKGVKYRFEAPNFDLGNELLEGIRRGDIRTSSFSFSISKGQKWEKRSNGTYLRTITKFDEIGDISPCYREAYEDTTVAIRSLEEFKGKPDLLELEDVKPDVAETAPEPVTKPSFDELSEYYKGLQEDINKLK